MLNKKYFIFSFLFLFMFFQFVSAYDYENVNLTEINYCLNSAYSYAIDMNAIWGFDTYCDSYNVTWRIAFRNATGSLKAYGYLSTGLCSQYYNLGFYDYVNISSDDEYLIFHPEPSEHYTVELDLYTCDTHESCADNLIHSYHDVYVNSSCELPEEEEESSYNGTLNDFISYYRLNQTSGSAIDYGLYGIDLTTVDNTTGNSNGEQLCSNCQSSYKFVSSGTSSGSSFSTSSYPTTAYDDITICYWISLDSGGASWFIYNMGTSANKQPSGSDLPSSLTPEFAFGDNNNPISTTAPILEDENYLICGMYDSSNNNQTIWLNGVLNVSESRTVTLSTWDNDFWIGKRNDYYGFSGNLSDLIIWNHTLNSTQMSELYNGGNGIDFFSTGGGSTSTPTLNTSLPNVNLGTFQINNTNLDLFFWNVTDYILQIDNGNDLFVNISNAVYNMSSTSNYEITVATYTNNNTISIFSNMTNFTANITVYACNNVESDPPVYISGSNCVSDVFSVTVNNASGYGVLENHPFNSFYELEFLSLLTFNLDYYYSNYDSVNYTWNDSNFSGNVGKSGSGTYSYTGSGPYNITLTCFKSNSSYVWADLTLNTTLSCSNSSQATLTINQTAFLLGTGSHALGDEYQYVFIQAHNSINSSTLTSFLLNTTFNDWWINSTYWDNNSISWPFNLSSLFDAIPKNDDNDINAWFVLITLAIVSISAFIFFILVLRIGKLGIFIWLLITWAYMLFLSVGTYLPWAYTIVPPILFIIYSVLKFTGGGS